MSESVLKHGPSVVRRVSQVGSNAIRLGAANYLTGSTAQSTGSIKSQQNSAGRTSGSTYQAGEKNYYYTPTHSLMPRFQTQEELMEHLTSQLEKAERSEYNESLLPKLPVISVPIWQGSSLGTGDQTYSTTTTATNHGGGLDVGGSEGQGDAEPKPSQSSKDPYSVSVQGDPEITPVNEYGEEKESDPSSSVSVEQSAELAAGDPLRLPDRLVAVDQRNGGSTFEFNRDGSALIDQTGMHHPIVDFNLNGNYVVTSNRTLVPIARSSEAVMKFRAANGLSDDQSKETLLYGSLLSLGMESGKALEVCKSSSDPSKFIIKDYSKGDMVTRVSTDEKPWGSSVYYSSREDGEAHLNGAGMTDRGSSSDRKALPPSNQQKWIHYFKIKTDGTKAVCTKIGPAYQSISIRDKGILHEKSLRGGDVQEIIDPQNVEFSHSVPVDS